MQCKWACSNRTSTEQKSPIVRMFGCPWCWWSLSPSFRRQQATGTCTTCRWLADIFPVNLLTIGVRRFQEAPIMSHHWHVQVVWRQDEFQRLRRMCRPENDDVDRKYVVQYYNNLYYETPEMKALPSSANQVWPKLGQWAQSKFKFCLNIVFGGP